METQDGQDIVCPVSSVLRGIEKDITSFISISSILMINAKIIPHGLVQQRMASRQVSLAFMPLVSQHLQDDFRERHAKFDCYADTSSVFLST